MTVIVGILNAKGCVLASDSAQSNSNNNKITLPYRFISPELHVQYAE